jgi:hypothetical protein
MYVCIIDAEGEVLFHRNLDARPEKLLEAIAPYRDDLVISTECMHCWYWVADLCAEQGIPFVLGHALQGSLARGELGLPELLARREDLILTAPRPPPT